MLAVGDVCTWQLPQRYDLITAWDSTFPLPVESQEPVLQKLCEELSKRGVLLFTPGGVEERGSIRAEFGGKPFEYSSLGIPEFARLLGRCGCTIQHMEYDQYPERHVSFIAKKLSRLFRAGLSTVLDPDRNAQKKPCYAMTPV